MATYAQQANSGKDTGGNNSNSGHNNSGGGGNSYSSSHNNINSHGNNNKSSDGSKKEEFRNYLEKSGLLDTLTKVLVGLYEEPERPSNAVEYIKRYLGAPKNVDVAALQRENEQLRRQLAALSEKNSTQTHNNNTPTDNTNTSST
mmetsp:Transcript_18495/g.40255  ORF Transcript_18495/g.40255 Transcript_18495/m.40255 type:complete len:145 (-) Transcript_18495:202-636(-)